MKKIIWKAVQKIAGPLIEKLVMERFGGRVDNSMRMREVEDELEVLKSEMRQLMKETTSREVIAHSDIPAGMSYEQFMTAFATIRLRLDALRLVWKSPT